jgi:exonuclease III
MKRHADVCHVEGCSGLLCGAIKVEPEPRDTHTPSSRTPTEMNSYMLSIDTRKELRELINEEMGKLPFVLETGEQYYRHRALVELQGFIDWMENLIG